MGASTNLQKVGSRMTKDEIIQQLKQGKESMPAFEHTLSAKEIDSLADWLSEHK